MADFLDRWRVRRPRESFEVLMAPHIDHLYRLAFRFTRSTPAAEDLVQDVLIKACRLQHEIALLENPRAWLARVLYREYVDRWRREKLAPISLSTLESDDEASGTSRSEGVSEHDPERDAMSTQLRERLVQAIALLNEDQRAVILFHDVEGYTLEEISVVLTQPIGTLKSRIHRGRARLREILNGPQGTFPAGDTYLEHGLP